MQTGKDFSTLSYSQPLPSAINGTRKNLSPEGMKAIRDLTLLQPRKFMTELVLAWVVIVASISIAVHLDNIVVTIIAILIVASRQNVLGLLVHEQVHYLGLRNKWGDLITDMLASYPLIMLTVKGYAKVHLTHHKHFMEDVDPDLNRKSGTDWIFPMESGQLLTLFIKDFLGITFINNVKGKNVQNTAVDTPRLSETPRWVRPVYFIAVAAIITALHGWPIVLLYWFLPLLTVFQAIIRLGGICEHQYIYNGSLEETTPLIIRPWWERALMPNLNFTLHVYHHYFANVPFYNLPQVHEIFVKEGLINNDALYQGVPHYIKSLLKLRTT